MRQPGARRRWGIAAAAIAAVAVGLALTAATSDAYPWLKGAAIYHGYLHRQGRILGHEVDLPARASRCANCHDAQQAGDSVRLVSPLSRVALTQPQRRRGGPPSVYDQQAFCNFLRTGIDPAYVLVDRTMPRFAFDDADCNALWIYVSSR